MVPANIQTPTPPEAIQHKDLYRKELHEEEFFECAETNQELISLFNREPEAEPSTSRSISNLAAISINGGRDLSNSADQCAQALARRVLERARSEFIDRNVVMRTRCPELEWADLAAAQRMVRAMLGNEERAVKLLVQALELRERDRSLYTTLHCEESCDMRIIGEDKELRPVIYFCAKSQTGGVRAIRDQFITVFETACRMASADNRPGNILFLVDSHDLQTRQWTDFGAITDLADVCGCVFAERIAKIVIVDFSSAAQTAWWVIKRLLNPVTQRKFNFVSLLEAKTMCQEELEMATAKRVLQSFEVNRNNLLSVEDRHLHGKCTSIRFSQA